MTSAAAVRSFHTQFGGKPGFLVRSPGRVNLIGEHTDYNEGFVLPYAIDRALWIALRPRSDARVRVWSALDNRAIEFHVDSLSPGGGWSAYVQGVAHQLVQAGYRPAGWEGTIVSDIPPRAGLSSSAALELAAARAFAAVTPFEWDPMRMALIAQRAENDWVGVNCGIMDQLVCAAGLGDRALLIDCRTLTWTPVAIPSEATIVVLDTNTSRELAGSAYNNRRADCEAAAAVLGITALRDLDLITLETVGGRLDPTVFRRARHVVTENERTLEMVDALNEGDLIKAGRLMNAGHTSLRDDFEASSPALDGMADAAKASVGCYGARPTGGGFGGSCVALVAAGQIDAFEQETLERYKTASGLKGSAIRTRPAAGTSLEPVPSEN